MLIVKIPSHIRLLIRGICRSTTVRPLLPLPPHPIHTLIVPTRWGALNLLFGEVPPGDDYYLIFLNVTHGLVYSISAPFTILPAAVSSANATQQIAPDAVHPTVTVTGAPGPTMVSRFGDDWDMDVS